MWPFQRSSTTHRSFCKSTPQSSSYSTQTRPGFSRLDSTGEENNLVPPPIHQMDKMSGPIQTCNKRRRDVHTGNVDPQIHGHQPCQVSHPNCTNHTMFGLHQKTFAGTPNAQLPGHQDRYFNYSSPQVAMPAMGFGARYMYMQQHTGPQYNNVNMNVPYQFGTGADYNFNPQLYPWSMHSSSSPPLLIPPQALQVQGQQPSLNPSQHHAFRKQNFNTMQKPQQQSHRGGHHKKRLRPSHTQRHSPHSTNVHTTRETSVDGPTGPPGPTAMSLPAQVADVTSDLQALAVSSESDTAVNQTKVGASPMTGKRDNASEHDNASEVCDLKVPCNTNEIVPKVEKKSVVVSVQSFFERASPPDSDSEQQVTPTPCDQEQSAMKGSPESVAAATPHPFGLQSELNVIKDTFLQCDKVDSVGGDSNSRAPKSTPTSQQCNKNVHYGSFHIRAIVSPSKIDWPESEPLRDSLAGVHKPSTSTSDPSQPHEFSARVSVLTPNNDCSQGARRKRCPPSAKKRRRQRAQRSENQSASISNCEPNRQQHGSVSSGVLIPSQQKFSFFVDMSDCENDLKSPIRSSPELKSSPQSPCFSKFAFVIRPSDNSDDSESSFGESDDDGFDEDEEDAFDEALWNSFNITCRFSPCVEPSATVEEGVEASTPEPCSQQQAALDTDSDEKPSVTEANQRWNKLYSNIHPGETKPETPKKVLFAEGDLTTVHVEEDELTDDYQAARKGPWEEIARDRCRFKSRVEAFQNLITPYFQVDYRRSIYNRYHSNSEGGDV